VKRAFPSESLGGLRAFHLAEQRGARCLLTNDVDREHGIEVLEPRRRQLGVANRVQDRTMNQPLLNSTGRQDVGRD
jgi:hypothetical protein